MNEVVIAKCIARKESIRKMARKEMNRIADYLKGRDGMNEEKKTALRRLQFTLKDFVYMVSELMNLLKERLEISESIELEYDEKKIKFKIKAERITTKITELETEIAGRKDLAIYFDPTINQFSPHNLHAIQWWYDCETEIIKNALYIIKRAVKSIDTETGLQLKIWVA